MTRQCHTKPATKLGQTKKPSLQLTTGLHNTASFFMKNMLRLQQLRFTLQLIIFRIADLLFFLQYSYCIPISYILNRATFQVKKKKKEEEKNCNNCRRLNSGK